MCILSPQIETPMPDPAQSHGGTREFEGLTTRNPKGNCRSETLGDFDVFNGVVFPSSRVGSL